MFLKRKLERTPSVGDICVVKKNIKESLKSRDDYNINTSAVLASKVSGYYHITQNCFRRAGKDFKFADVEMVYILEESFAKGLFKTIPLSYDEEGRFLIEESLKKKKYFLSKKESLSRCSNKQIDFLNNNRPDYLLNRIKDSINDFLNESKKSFVTFAWFNS